jgi:YVTN family beta-propeller protein
MIKMILTDLSKGMRSAVAMLAIAGMLAACSENKDEASTERLEPDATTPEANTGETFDGANNAPQNMVTNVAYVTNQDKGITVIDLGTMQPVDEIEMKAEDPRGLGITEDGKQLIVATKDGTVAVIDTASRKVVKHIEVGKNPEFVRVKGNLVFVSFEPSSKGGPPPKPGEEEEEEESDEPKEPARIAVIDIEKGQKIREITGGPETEGIEFSKDGSKLIITNEADNTVTVHDIENGNLLKTIDTKEHGIRPRGIKVSPDGETYVATLEHGNTFMVLDKDFNHVKTVKTGVSPYGVAFGPEGDRLFVASAKGKTLEVFDAKTYEKIKDIGPTGDRCWHFSFTPDNKQILLACGRSDEVIVIDADKLEITKRITDFKMPWGIVTYPKSIGSLDQPV